MALMWIHVGPQHPVNHGLWMLKILTDGEHIHASEVHIGYIYRMIEKIAEDRTWQQFVPITDRLCYVANMSWEYGYVKAVEELFGIEVPERAEYIRVILLELQRIVSHLVFLSAIAGDLGLLTMLVLPYRDREYALDILEHLTGARLMYHYMRVGGLRNDLYEGFEEDLLAYLDYQEKAIKDYEELMVHNEVSLMRMKGISPVSAKEALDLGLTGPMLRATGVKADVRKLEPYSFYKKFNFDIPTGKNGDIYDRFMVRLQEIKESIKIIRQAINKIPDGPIMIRRVPTSDPGGYVYSRTEDPRGEQAYHIVGTKGKNAYRVKIKSPAMLNLFSAERLLRDTKIADFAMILASVDLCMGEIDR